MSFKLKERGLELELKILDLAEVHIHEEIVPELLEKLVKDIKTRRVISDPLLIDKKTKVVLDGMHRVAALKKLGYKYLPVCEVDYDSPKVKVGCWYRVVEGGGGDKIPKILMLLGLESEVTSIERAKKELEERRAVAALLSPKNCLLIWAEKNDIHESYVWIKRIELALKEGKLKVRYEREPDAEKNVTKRTAVLMVPCVKKEEIIATALSDSVFAHKTTRHVVEGRPLNVKVPIAWLDGKMSLTDVNKKLRESLSKRRHQYLLAGSSFKGRRLEGGVIVFR